MVELMAKWEVKKLTDVVVDTRDYESSRLDECLNDALMLCNKLSKLKSVSDKMRIHGLYEVCIKLEELERDIQNLQYNIECRVENERNNS